MTAAGGDLPDWTQAVNNPGTLIGVQPINGHGSFNVPVNSYNSVVVNVVGQTLGATIRLLLVFFTDSTLLTEVNQVTLTSVLVAGNVNIVGIELPVYGGYFGIVNQDLAPVTLTLIGSSRSVPAPRVLYANTPGRVFIFTGNIVNGTGLIIPQADNQLTQYAANGTSTVTFGANVPGNFFYNFIDANGAQRSFFLALVAAGVSSVVTVALPQGQGVFAFVPTGSNAAGSVTVIAAPSQL